MKKGLKLLGCILCTALLFSCVDPSNDEGGGAQPEKQKTLQQKIDEGVTDFGGVKATTDLVVDDTTSIKNLDMDGKTLTIASPDVILEKVLNAIILIADGDASLKDCQGIEIEIDSDASNSDAILIDSSEIKSIKINKDDIRLVIKDESTTVREIVITAENITVEADADENETAPVIEKLTVTEDADNVSISGGKIEELVVDTPEGTKEEDKPTITLTGETEIEKIEGTETIYVTEDTEATLPKDFEAQDPVTIQAYGINNPESLKTRYTVGEKFDYTNLAVKIFYSNGSTKVIPLTKDNCTITGFDSKQPGSCKIEITYDDNYVGDFVITIIEPVTSEKASDYINAAIAILTAESDSTPDVDLAVEYFKKAYEIEKSDETKLYYALAELASISTDKSVAKLLKENFGIINYPSSPNALLSLNWVKQYDGMSLCEVYEFEKNPNGNYIRGEMPEDYSKTSSIRFNYKCKLVEGNWIEPKDWTSSLLSMKPSADGKVMFEFNRDYVYYADPAEEEKAQEEFKNFRKENKDYIYSLNGIKSVMLPSSLTGNYSMAVGPEFSVIDKKDSDYQATLFNSMQTSETVAYLMLSNLFACNAEGFNKLIDNILNVFGTRYENAKALVANIKQENITISANVISALELDELLGSNSVKIGKAEIDVLFAAMDIYKGLFQWFSSYDFSFDLDLLKKRVFSYHDPNNPYSSWNNIIPNYVGRLPYNLMYELPTLFSLSNKNTLAVRNKDAMAASKATILNAVNTVLASYKYITEDSKMYPAQIKEMIQGYAGPYVSYVEGFAKALKDGKVFELKLSEDAGFAIDLGKLFTAGYFSDLIEKTKAGNVKFVAQAYGTNAEELIPFAKAEEYEIDLGDLLVNVPAVLKKDGVTVASGESMTVNSLYGYTTLKLSKLLDLIPDIEAILPEKMLAMYNKKTGLLSVPIAANIHVVITNAQ